MPTLLYTGKLEITSCWCGIRLAVPDDLYRQARDRSKHIYCPLGHSFVFNDNDKEKRLERELAFERDRRASLQADNDRIRASRSAIKGQVTKLRKRIVAGVCPFGCTRHFANIERHVATKHPGMAFEAELPESD